VGKLCAETCLIQLRIALQPKQRQFLETIESTSVTFYGGAKGGGKSKGLQLIMLYRRLKYPGSHGAIFRRTYPELEGNHIRPLFEAFPQLRSYWSESKKLLTLPNGSTLQFCHCQNENDVGLYQGREFHDLAIDEAGQWTEQMFRTLQGSNRSSKPGIRPRTILTGNPGGIGHGWLKRLFIERRFNEREIPESYAFIQALVDDNKALVDNDPDYITRLESEPNEALRRAFRYGDWNVFAGQFFQELSKEHHFIKPFPIPAHWNRFGAYDFGFNHPAAFGWFANDEDGNTYLYRELVLSGQRVDQFAKRLLEHPDTTKIYPIVAGHDCWTTKGVLRDEPQPPTIAEEFARHGIRLQKAVIDRIQGAAQLRSYLALRGYPNPESTIKRPRFFIFDTCPISFDAISRMIYDPDRPEDVLKVDATEGNLMSGDDAYDMVRYGLMSRPYISIPLKPLATEIQVQEQMHIEAAKQAVQRENDLRKTENPYGTWQKDKKGIADWNKW
jgi:phage terminase large subunit